MSTPSRPKAALLRFLLLLYPRDFRRSHKQELESAYTHCLRVEGRRKGELVATLLACLDAASAGVAMRRLRFSRSGPVFSSGFAFDLKVSVRSLVRTPGFLFGTVLMLALGIGANGAIFSLVYAVLLEPLPYVEPQRLVLVSDALAPPASFRRIGTTGEVILDWRAAGAFDDLAALKMWDGNLDAQFDLLVGDRAERLRAGLVTPNFFELLGAEAQVGRVFSTEDERAGRDDLVVLSHGLWQRAFGGDPAIVGHRVSFITGSANRRPESYTIVGVVPPRFQFTYPVGTELWAIHPWARVRNSRPDAVSYNGAVARLAPGDSPGRVAGRLQATVGSKPRIRTHVEPVTEWVNGEIRPAVLLVAGVALLLLGIACATVANALLVRLSKRRRELAVRASLGAPQHRLFRQLLTEGLALSLLGTLAGAGLAAAVLPIFKSLVPPLVPRADEIALGGWFLLFGAGSATTVTVLATVFPAVRASHVDLRSAIAGMSGAASTSRSATRLRFGLLATQSAVSTGLMVGAALLLVSFWRLAQIDLGFDGANVVTVEMRLLDRKYREDGAIAAFRERLLSRVRSLPGVLEAGITSAVPFRGVDFSYGFDRPGGDGRIGANGRTVDPSFFSIMGIRPAQGRVFTDADTSSSPRVAVISQSFAREMFRSHDETVVGRTFGLRGSVVVVGVVPDLRYVSQDQPPRPAFYLPASQNPVGLMCLVLRTAPGLTEIGPLLRQTVHNVDPTVPAMKITTIDRIITESVADRRFYTTMTSVFATLALLLTAAGLFVVITRAVAERSREIAIRSALGARSLQLVGMMTRQGLAPALFGVVAGLLLASWSAQILEGFVFGVESDRVAIYTGASLLTLAVAGVACLVPAHRTSRLAPARLLRER